MTSVYQYHVNGSLTDYGEFPLLMPRWGYAAAAFTLFLIGFFGFFLNLMVIMLMFKDRQLWTPLNLILFNLVCSDFSVSVLGNPLTLISALFHHWVFGHSMCVVYGFFMALLGISSITTLTVLSFERYMMVTRPLSSPHLSHRGALAAVAFIWCYSLALTTPPLFGWGNYVNEAANISCSVNWHEQSTNTLTYILFLFAWGQVVPLLVIGYSYVNIIRTIRHNSARLGRAGRAEQRVTGMVFVMIVSFSVAWTPYSVFALLEQFAEGKVTSPGLGVIPALVAKSSICYDPLIYIGMNTQFRQSIKRLFGIHSKAGQSHTEKCCDNTVMSPTHKLSRLNDTTSRIHSIDSTVPLTHQTLNVSKPDVTGIAEEGKVCLTTIPESRTTSDVDKSSETTCDRDSTEKRSEDPLKEPSPVLTIIDSERLAFSKQQNKELDSGYGNSGFEDHATDKTAATPIELPHFAANNTSGGRVTLKAPLSLDSKIDVLNSSSNYYDTQKIYSGNYKNCLCSESKDDCVV